MKVMRSRLLTWVVIIFLIGFSLPGVDNAAHFGGLAAGFVLGKLFADREPLAGAEWQRAQALGWLAGIIVLASFAMMLKQFVKI
jgi:rhomboid protease GluP